MARTEYYDDPEAPTPNSLVPAVVVFVQDQDDRVLLVRRSDNGLWSLPGGTMELGESISQCGEREVLEETGFEVEIVGVVGLYSDPKQVIAYDDGEVRQQFAISLRGKVIAGARSTSAETPDVRWISAADLGDVSLSPGTQVRVDHGFLHVDQATLG